MNTIAKMRRVHAKGRKLFESRGYEVITAPHGRFDRDWFGIADSIAISPAETLFIQYSANKFHSKKIYREFSKQYPKIIVVLACWVDRKGFSFRIFEGGKEIK